MDGEDAETLCGERQSMGLATRNNVYSATEGKIYKSGYHNTSRLERDRKGKLVTHHQPQSLLSGAGSSCFNLTRPCT